MGVFGKASTRMTQVLGEKNWRSLHRSVKKNCKSVKTSWSSKGLPSSGCRWRKSADPRLIQAVALAASVFATLVGQQVRALDFLFGFLLFDSTYVIHFPSKRFSRAL
jgi:hypothetical protein